MTTTSSSILSSLALYGFKPSWGGLLWGAGSLVWGHSVAIRQCGGRDLYKVTICHWSYDECMDPIYDTEETRELHGAEALTWIFEEVPAFFWHRK